jgi:MFS family permease
LTASIAKPGLIDTGDISATLAITRNRAGERHEPGHRALSVSGRFSALAPFRIRNYRFQWPSDLLTSWAFEMETLILGWYVLVETGSVLLLTLFASLNYTGTMLAPLFGVIGDRIGHRDLLAAMRASYAALAATLMTLALTDHLNATIVLVIAGLMGIVRPSDLGVRGALVATIMPHNQLIGSIAVSRTTMDLARIAGALSGTGLFAGAGLGPAYVVIVSLYVIATVLTLCVVVPRTHRPVDEAAAPVLLSSPLHDLQEGIAHVWASPRMRAAIWIAFLTNLTAYPFTNGLLPYIAREIYGANQTILGYLSAGFAVGSLIGSVTLSAIGGVRVARLMIATTVMWYVGLLVFAQMPNVPTAIVSLTMAGISQSMCMITVAVILMRTAGERFRGRVMGVRMLTVYGLPFGLMVAGSLIDAVGFAATLTLYVAAGLAMVMAVALHWRADLLHLHAPANAK